MLETLAPILIYIAISCLTLGGLYCLVEFVRYQLSIMDSDNGKD